MISHLNLFVPKYRAERTYRAPTLTAGDAPFVDCNCPWIHVIGDRTDFPAPYAQSSLDGWFHDGEDYRLSFERL